MTFLRNVSYISILNIATAGLSLAWIPTLITTLGTEDYGKFVLTTTLSSIFFSLLYINNWQWLLIQLDKKSFGATRISIANDLLFTAITITVSAQLPQLNAQLGFSPKEYLPILQSHLIGLALSHQSIYIAYYRHQNRFTPPAVIALTSELLKATSIYAACFFAETKTDALTTMTNTLWLFCIPHVAANIISSTALKPFGYKTNLLNDISSFTSYNFYLHQKNIADLLINHFDKIIVKANLGYHSLAIYDLLKKAGYAFSKLLAPVYPIIFRDLVSAARSGDSLRDKLNHHTQIFTLTSLAIYGSLEIILYLSNHLPNPAAIIETLNQHQTEIRLYVTCHLLGFSFCAYHLLPSVLEKTKIDFYLTVTANLLFTALFYATTKHTLLLGIISILIQYASLILAKIWIAKKLT